MSIESDKFLKINILSEIRTLFPNLPNDWEIVYKDIQKIVYTKKKTFNFRSLIAASLCRALGDDIKRQIKDSTHNITEIKFSGEGIWKGDLDIKAKRNNLLLPDDPEYSKEILSNWKKNLKNLFIELKKHFLPNLIKTDQPKIIEHKKPNQPFSELEFLKNQIILKLNHYSDSMSMMYNDICSVMFDDNIFLSTKKTAIAALLRQFSGALLYTSQFLIGKENEDLSKHKNKMHKKKKNLCEMLQLDEIIIDEVFPEGPFELVHRNPGSDAILNFDSIYLLNYSQNLLKFLNELDAFYHVFIDKIDSYSKKDVFSDSDISNLSQLTMSRNLMKRFLFNCSSPSAFQQLFEHGFFKNPYLKTHHKTDYLFGDIFPLSVTLKSRVSAEPYAVLSIIQDWPANIDSRVRRDCFQALRLFSPNLAAQALSTVNSWCEYLQHFDHEIDDFIDYLEQFKDSLPNHQKAVYFKLIKKIFQGLLKAHQPKSNDFSLGTMSPIITDSKIHNISLSAYTILGNKFLKWFLSFYKSAWETTLKKNLTERNFYFAWHLWMPKITLPKLNSKTSHSQSFLITLTQTTALLLHYSLNTGKIANKLKIFKLNSYPAMRRLCYFFMCNWLQKNTKITGPQKEIIKYFILSKGDFYNLDVIPEYGEFLILYWQFLDLETQNTLWKWWQSANEEQELSFGTKINFLRASQAKLPKIFQEELEKINTMSEAENSKEPSLPKLNVEIGKSPIIEFLNEIKKDFLMLSNEQAAYFRNLRKSFLISTLSQDVKIRPNEYLKKNDLWMRFPSELSLKILNELHESEINFETKDWLIFLSETKKSSPQLDSTIFYHVLNFLDKSLKSDSYKLEDGIVLCMSTAQALYIRALNFPSNLKTESPQYILHYAAASYTGATLRLIYYTLGNLHQNYPDSKETQHCIDWIFQNLKDGSVDASFFTNLGENASFLEKIDLTFFDKLLENLINAKNHEYSLFLWVGLSWSSQRLNQKNYVSLLPLFPNLIDLLVQKAEQKFEWLEVIEWLGTILIRNHLFYEISSDCKAIIHFWKASPLYVRQRVINQASRMMGGIKLLPNTNIDYYNKIKSKYIELLHSRIDNNCSTDLEECFWFYDNLDLFNESLVVILEILLIKHLNVEPLWNVLKFIHESLLKFPSRGVRLFFNFLNSYESDKLASFVQEINVCFDLIDPSHTTEKVINQIRSIIFQKLGKDISPKNDS